MDLVTKIVFYIVIIILLSAMLGLVVYLIRDILPKKEQYVVIYFNGEDTPKKAIEFHLPVTLQKAKRTAKYFLRSRFRDYPYAAIYVRSGSPLDIVRAIRSETFSKTNLREVATVVEDWGGQ